MSTSKDSDVGFPWCEEQNFTGWLFASPKVGRTRGPRSASSTDLDAQLNSDELSMMRLLNINGSTTLPLQISLRRAVNPRVKNLSESGEFNTAFELLQRLRQRYNTVDDISKAKHMLNYHALTQNEAESGAEFVDRELREYLACETWACRSTTLRLTKFIQQDTTNAKHKQLAQRFSRRLT